MYVCMYIGIIAIQASCNKTGAPTSPSKTTAVAEVTVETKSDASNTVPTATPTSLMVSATTTATAITNQNSQRPATILGSAAYSGKIVARTKSSVKKASTDQLHNCYLSGDASDVDGVVVSAPYSGWGDGCNTSVWVSDSASAKVSAIGETLHFYREFDATSDSTVVISFKGDDAVSVSFNGTAIGGCSSICFPDCTSLSVPSSLLVSGTNKVDFTVIDVYGDHIALSYSICLNGYLPDTETPTFTDTDTPTDTETETFIPTTSDTFTPTFTPTFTSMPTTSATFTFTPTMISTCDPNSREVSTGIKTGYEFPLGIDSMINKALSCLPFDIQIKNVKYLFQGTKKDCCLNGVNIPGGIKKESGAVNFTLWAKDVPLYSGFSVSKTIRGPFGTISISVAGGVLLSLENTVLLQGGVRSSECNTAENCGFGTFETGFSPTLKAQVSAESCYKLSGGSKTCDGFEFIPVGANNRVSINGSLNQKSCEDGYKIRVSLSETTVFGQIKVAGFSQQFNLEVFGKKDFTLAGNN